MSFEQASIALQNFSELHAAYKVACDAESARLAEKLSADAELGLATSQKESADTAAEDALRVLLAALAAIGVNP